MGLILLIIVILLLVGGLPRWGRTKRKIIEGEGNKKGKKYK